MEKLMESIRPLVDIITSQIPKYTPYFKELAEAIEVFAKSAKKNSGKMLDAPDRITPSEKFKKIYFAYESYQIDAKTTMRLLKEHCGIVNKVTFFLTAKDYERSIGYSKDLSDELYTICTLPKRCNSIYPSECHISG